MAVTCTHGMAVPTCTLATGATLSFGAVVALADTGPVTTNSGSSFWLNCTADVAAPPALYAATPRRLVSGSSSLPFTLSVVAPGGAELPAASPGTPLLVTRDGSNQTVTLHGRLDPLHFGSLPAGRYAGSLVLTLEY